MIVDLWVRKDCGTPRYILHSYYYSIPIIDVCPGVILCYGRHHPREVYELYSTTDGVHPWGKEGVPFLGEVLYSWYKQMNNILSNDVSLNTDGKYVSHAHSFDNLYIPSTTSTSTAVTTTTTSTSTSTTRNVAIHSTGGAGRRGALGQVQWLHVERVVAGDYE